MEIDLHGYHPAEIVFNGVLGKILQQSWEMGEIELILYSRPWAQSGHYTGIREHEHRLLWTVYSAGIEGGPVISPVVQAYDARLPTDRQYLNQTEDKSESDEKTIGWPLRCRNVSVENSQCPVTRLIRH
jgi:hypothetical protein